LNAIINYIEIALEKPLDDSTREVLYKSHSASVSLVYAIEDLLSIAKAKEDHLPILEYLFDLHDAIVEAVDPLIASAKSQEVEFHFMHNDTKTRLLVKEDLHRFQQVVTSVVSNAIQYTNKGSVNVDLQILAKNEEHSLIQVQVHDTGVGMSEQDLDDLFHDMEHISLSHERTRSDQKLEKAETLNKICKLGMGLAVVARYVRLRNGQLLIRSKQGKGTTVSLTLPFPLSVEPSLPFHPIGLNPIPKRQPSDENDLLFPSIIDTESSTQSLSSTAPSTATYISSKPPEPRHGSSRFRPTTSSASIEEVIEPLIILAADDNNINIQILQRRLEKLGHEVLISRDGQQCYDVFARNTSSIQFILMDLNVRFMPHFISSTHNRRCPSLAVSHLP
jgi:CheY-like chemotaxis protein/two-component sensor histidine kinase